jgi:hypothetical protein
MVEQHIVQKQLPREVVRTVFNAQHRSDHYILIHGGFGSEFDI